MEAGPGALLTDLYQLTMLDAYRQERLAGRAVFELFTRRLPPGRGFLVAAGLEQALDFLAGLRFTETECEWLAASGRFDAGFVDWLADFAFRGDVWALPEGSVFFADVPVLRIEAELPEAQLVESRLMNIVHFQTLVASKAARSVLVAGDRRLVDFGMRRAHEAEAALYAARAAWIAGFDGTATLLAGQCFGLPLYGTMAHSYVQAHRSEAEAFAAFASARPEGVVLLADTYDVDAAVDAAVRLARTGTAIAALRLDSGDLAAGSARIRARLDAAGYPGIGVFLSGNLDEYAIAELVAAGAPVVGFGVGTQLVTGGDAPSLDFAYKLQAFEGRPTRKRSPGKATWPGAKQVIRRQDANGRMAGDRLVAAEEDAAGEGLLVQVMAGGRRVAPPASLAAARDRARASLAALPERLKRLDAAADYPVERSERVESLARQADASQVPA
jgi:nicotinate phosphoribosyltransferase